ncbi:MAG TPA: SEC-C metal-binding domain-containing protein, partial [Rhodocyclaceae bacterium]|nr:SEC-C metal-binding domain-containing protein [Rhodocyclaceae bacterium]
YLHGVDEAIEDWFDNLDEEESGFLDERLYPLIVLTGEAEAAAKEHGEKWPEGEELDELMKDCEEEVPGAVEDIHRFWMAKRGAPTQRRETPKVGRNDPCPCGSGKKYKQCCGA